MGRVLRSEARRTGRWDDGVGDGTVIGPPQRKTLRVVSNPESSVGLMSMGGKGPEVLTTLTTERGKLLDGLYRTKKKISGSSHLATGIQIASVRQLSKPIE